MKTLPSKTAKEAGLPNKAAVPVAWVPMAQQDSRNPNISLSVMMPRFRKMEDGKAASKVDFSTMDEDLKICRSASEEEK